MPRFSDAQLLGKALQALKKIYERAEQGPVDRTAELRFLFAFLANHVDDRAVLDKLWVAIARPKTGNDAQDFGRHQTLRNLAGVVFDRCGSTLE